jgi:hypothetical protein
VLDTLAFHLRQRGARATASAGLRVLRRQVYLHERFIVLLKELDAIVEPLRRTGLRVEDLGAHHLADLSKLNRARGHPGIDRRFASYVESGFRGFVGYSGDDIVAYYWWVDAQLAHLFPDLRDLGLGIELGPGDVYGSDFYLLEQHRGGAVAGGFLFNIESALRERGYRRLWGYVASDNRPARWIYSIRGYSPMWVVERTRVLRAQRIRREPLSATEVVVSREVAE